MEITIKTAVSPDKAGRNYAGRTVPAKFYPARKFFFYALQHGKKNIPSLSPSFAERNSRKQDLMDAPAFREI